MDEILNTVQKVEMRTVLEEQYFAVPVIEAKMSF